MLVIDVTWNQLKALDTDHTKRFFYLVHPDRFEIFTVLNNMMFRYNHKRGTQDEDSLWSSINLANSVQAQSISYFRENEYKEAINVLNESIKTISEEIAKLKDGV